MKNTLLRFYGYRCPRCGDETWLADIPEKFIYCALCDGEGNLSVTKTLTIRGGDVEMELTSYANTQVPRSTCRRKPRSRKT
jgi:ribosomal protein S27AE